jgi:hypothetical protein
LGEGEKRGKGRKGGTDIGRKGGKEKRRDLVFGESEPS